MGQVAAIMVARLHHEKIDASGYPLRLASDDIPIIARMRAICDVYDALKSSRAYKEAWTPARALEEMAASAGHFDRDLLKAFAVTIDVAIPALADCGAADGSSEQCMAHAAPG